MDTLTYSIIIGVVFFAGIFLFSYFETPRETLNKGINKLRNIKVSQLKKGTSSFLSVPFKNKVKDDDSGKGEINIYVQEY